MSFRSIFSRQSLTKVLDFNDNLASKIPYINPSKTANSPLTVAYNKIKKIAIFTGTYTYGFTRVATLALSKLNFQPLTLNQTKDNLQPLLVKTVDYVNQPWSVWKPRLTIGRCYQNLLKLKPLEYTVDQYLYGARVAGHVLSFYFICKCATALVFYYFIDRMRYREFKKIKKEKKKQQKIEAKSNDLNK